MVGFCRITILIHEWNSERIYVRSFWKKRFNQFSSKMDPDPPSNSKPDFSRFTNKYVVECYIHV